MSDLAIVDSSTSAADSVAGWVSLMWTSLFRIVAITGGLTAILGGALYVNQERLLYMPELAGQIPRRPRDNPRGYRSPEERDIASYENVSIECDDGVHINAWLLLYPTDQPGNDKKQQSRPPTIVFFHGNAGNIGLRLPNSKLMMQQLHCNVLMVEYRGYGDSDQVSPNEIGLQRDAAAALRFCQQHARIDPSKIFLFGRSLGGAVAFYLAQYAQQHKIPLAGVIVENTFLSISAMVDQLLPVLRWIKPFVLRMHWNSAIIVPTLRVPLLYLAGVRDELVPHAHMQQLFSLSRQSTLLQMHPVENGTHNETWVQGGPAYWQAMRNFIQQAIRMAAKNDIGTNGTCHSETAAAAISPDLWMTAPVEVADDDGTDIKSIPTMSSQWTDLAQQAIGLNAPTTATTSGHKSKDL